MKLKLAVLVGLLSTLTLLCKAESILSVTDYAGSGFQISMVQHGEKFATDRPCYSFEDVPPRYHGMTHVRGKNYKIGTLSFRVNVEVKIYLAVDSRYAYTNGASFRNTGDVVVLGGCHPRTPLHIYESTTAHGPGLVQINFPHSRMTGIFVRDSRAAKPDAELHITVSSTWEISMVREGEKFSTDRDCYVMTDIPPRFYGMAHLRGINYKPTSFTLTVNVPVKVYVAVDSRYAVPLDTNQYKKTGEKIVHAGCHPRTDFPIWERVVHQPGPITIRPHAGRMMAIFIAPLYCDATFKSGVYS